LKISKYINWSGNIIASIMLLSMAFIPCAEFLGRYFFNIGISGATDYLQHLTLWIGLFGAILAIRDKKHLKITGSINWLPKPLKFFTEYYSYFIAAAVCWSLCGASIQLIIAEAPALPENFNVYLPNFIIEWLEPFGLFYSGGIIKIGGLIPQWIAEIIMPLGFGIMAVCFIICFTQKQFWSKFIIFLSLPFVIILSIIYPIAPANVVYIGIGILITSAALGNPIFVLLAGTALLLFWGAGVTTSSIPAEMYRIVVSPIFPTIPLFTFTGFLLSESKASERFAKMFQALFGWFPGGTALAVTLLCAFFTTFTGASGITILALGGLFLPVLLKSGTDEHFAIGLLTATGSIGLLLPPSLVVILYAVIAKVSVIDMFKASLLPGILLILPICFMCIWQGIKKDKKTNNYDNFNLRKISKAVWKAKWELLIPGVAMIGIFCGFCTIVEAAALTAVYTLIVETCIYRDLNFTKLYSLLVKCSVLIGGVLIIIGVAMGLTSYLVDAQVPMHIAEWAVRQAWPPWKFLLALNIALILVGCFMDIYSALIVVVPLILPMAEAFGIDTIHLGVIFLVNLQLGYLTPPVGMNLFLSAFRFNKSLIKIAKYAFPFLLVFLFIVILITYIPWFSVGVLNLLK
jgi:C4-dicarboxylate transporter, DctM subunit